MVNSTPVIGRNGWLKIGTQIVGYFKGFTVGVKRGTIKDYVFQSADPAILEAGNASYPFTCDLMHITSTYAALVLAGTKSTVEIAPENTTPTGQLKITLTNVILTDWELTSSQDGVVLEKVSGEGQTLAFTTY
ncbi:hypothetical protein MUP01_04710 [Candidatus Bathyarchaeota archaeon]|nr:hypothetical protein [Candidatus Bathyarchaeota archaeon]